MNNPTKKINFVAFSELRPGTAYIDTKDILLNHWRELKNTDEGHLSLYKFGCSLKVDVQGIIGEVSYSAKFPVKRVIAGLKRGMMFEEVKRLYPELQASTDEYNDIKYRCILPTTHVLEVFFYKDVLSSITIANPDAIYPRKEDNYIRDIYPVAVVSKPPLFQCSNLKLIVLNDLLSSGHIELGDYDELASFVLKRYIDFDEDEEINGYAIIPECLEYLYHYPLSADLLSKVDNLCLDGANEIYSYIMRYWGGEGDDFDVTSFRGVEHLPNLTSINISAMINLNSSERVFLQRLAQHGIEVTED